MQTIAFAIKMEADGAQYYREQADAFKDHPIAHAFELLVDAELKHQKLLEDYEAKKQFDSSVIDLSEQDNVFQNLSEFNNDLASIPRQLDVYRKALGLEKASIQLYSDLLEKTTDETGQQLLTFLVGEEKKHYALFDELVTMLRRPEDWVEDAEFGNREEY